jgi:hypothetical protein
MTEHPILDYVNENPPTAGQCWYIGRTGIEYLRIEHVLNFRMFFFESPQDAKKIFDDIVEKTGLSIAEENEGKGRFIYVYVKNIGYMPAVAHMIARA